MAGSYPDNPSRRIAWHDDGTLMLRNDDAGHGTEYSAANKTNFNKEVAGTKLTIGDPHHAYNCWIWPELREMDGSFLNFDYSAGWSHGNLEESGDTTNGRDGTWNAVQTPATRSGNETLEGYRDLIISMAETNVRGMRFRVDDDNFDNWRIKRFHWYGEISAGETPDRLLWFDDDDDLEFSKPQDYGDVPRGSAEDHVVYLKNNSASLSAGSVQVTAVDIYGGSGSWYTFDEGSGFSATLALAGSIASATDSPNITVRRITPDAESVGLHAAQVKAVVGSWT